MREAKIDDFEGLWNCPAHYFSMKNNGEAKEGEEYCFRELNRCVKTIVSEIDGDRIIFEIISKEA